MIQFHLYQNFKIGIHIRTDFKYTFKVIVTVKSSGCLKIGFGPKLFEVKIFKWLTSVSISLTTVSI